MVAARSVKLAQYPRARFFGVRRIEPADFLVPLEPGHLPLRELQTS